MLIKEMIVGLFGVCFGLLVAGGVFTVLIAVGLLPRFAGKTHTARYEVLYEEFIIYGTIVGCLFSIFDFAYYIGAFLITLPDIIYYFISYGTLIVIGIFSGMFVGCLALAIAEMIDSISIFSRRISFRHGLGIVVLAIALGKMCGSLIYFIKGFSG